MKKFFYLLILFLPFCVSAEEANYECKVVSETHKYYESLNYYNSFGDLELTVTNEIDEEKYNSDTASILGLSTTTETTYKKMTTTISTSGSYYRYKVVLNWKNMPKVRSYDVIGIGFYKSVTPKSNAVFSQEYCVSSSDCTTSSTNTLAQVSGGVSSIFKLPSSTSIVSLKQTLYVDVKKNVTSTITSQVAVGDYSHATKTSNSSIASNHDISISGIIFTDTSVDYYDEIDYAKATWSGSW